MFDPLGWQPFGPAKFAFIVLAVLISATLGLWRPPARFDPVLGMLWLGFLALVTVATLAGANDIQAWIGTPDRNFGYLTWLLVALAFVAGWQVERVELVGHALTLGLLASTGLAWAEWLGWNPAGIEIADNRLGGGYGSPAFFGAYLSLALPAAAALASGSRVVRHWRVLATVALVASAPILLASRTRAAWLGVIVGICIVGAAGRRLSSRLALGVLGGGALLTFTALGASSATRTRLTNLGSRPDEWRLGLQTLNDDNLLLGLGPEGYRLEAFAQLDLNYARNYGTDVIIDRAHNGLLDIALIAGVPAAALFAYLLVRTLRHAARSIDSSVQLGLFAGAVGYLIQQQFLFPISTIDPLLWFVLGALTAPTVTRQVLGSLNRLPTVVAAAVAVVALFIGVRTVAAERAMRTAIELPVSETPKAIANAVRAADLRPRSIRYLLAEATVFALPNTAAGFEAAIDRADAARKIAPDDPPVERAAALLRARRALLTNDDTHWTDAVDSLTIHLQREPLNATIHEALGDLNASRLEFGQAATHYGFALDLRPGDELLIAKLAAAENVN